MPHSMIRHAQLGGNLPGQFGFAGAGVRGPFDQQRALKRDRRVDRHGQVVGLRYNCWVGKKPHGLTRLTSVFAVNLVWREVYAANGSRYPNQWTESA